MMDFNLKQWRDQQQESEEEEQQPAAKIPRHHHQQLLFLETPHHQHQEAALPLFVSSDSESQPLSNTTNKIPPYSYSSGIPTFPREAGRCSFSIRQWQELELQALIFKHMIAGAAVPQELLQLVKKSLLSSTGSPFYNLHHQYQYEYPPHIQPAAALVQAAAGYCWGKGGMDPEPGRCRRTDGKKWRCSRDVVAGHKYCERHVHRGRNRSRKPVEFPPPSLSAASTTPSHFHLNPRSSAKESSDKVLMHFFDDWPRSSDGEGNANNNSSSIRLSMSNTTTGNSTSDFLRLSTGNGNEAGNENVSNEERHGDETMRWSTSMGMGGPLGEALGSSTDHSSSPSPTSVLHQLPPTSVPDNNYVAA